MQSEISHSSADVSDGKSNVQEAVGSEFHIQKSLVKPQIGIQDQTSSDTENVGNQEEIVLELLDVKVIYLEYNTTNIKERLMEINFTALCRIKLHQ